MHNTIKNRFKLEKTLTKHYGRAILSDNRWKRQWKEE